MNRLMVLCVGLTLIGSMPSAEAEDAAPQSKAASTQQPCVLENCLVMPADEAEVAAQEAGVLAEIKAKEGTTVRAGDALVRMDDRLAILEKQLAEYQFNAAEQRAANDINIRYSKSAADVAEAEHQASMDANRRVANSVSVAELRKLNLEHHKAVLQIEQSGVDYGVAKHEAKAASTKVAAAEENIRRRHITSPIPGVVDKIHRHAGEWVQPGDVVAHVVRLDRLRVEGFVKSDEYPRSRIRGRNAIIDVTLPGGQQRQLSGKVAFVSEVRQAAGDYRVWVELENAQDDGQWLLHPGDSVTLKIE
ncbi:MAG: HlyD family efflux transporter periplasmic adaptor subunit [Planctomycetes bacterium]|nr:HlyD family efflux transporter periplasmic adaptor subunit [Planctomycetota bacterium]